MKKLLTLLTLATIAASPLAGFAQTDLEKDPAYLAIDKFIDLKAIPPQVNVNLPRFLLKDVTASFAESTNNPLAGSGIDLPDLVKDVKLIRVVVIEKPKTTDSPASAKAVNLDKAVKSLRAELDSKWTAIVNVPENNVGVYAKSAPSGDSVAGLAVLIADGNNVVIVNLVGHVSIAKLMKVATQSNKFPKMFLKQLSKGNQPDSQPSAKAEMNANTNSPVEASGTK